MKKTLSMFLIVLMMFSQLSSTSVLFAESDTQNQESFEISVGEGASIKESIINVISQESIYDNLEITLPKDTSFNKEKTEEITESDVDISYNSDSHTVLMDNKTNAEKLTNKLVLNDVQESQNNIVVKGFKNDEMMASQAYTFSINQNDESNQQEEQSNETDSTDTTINTQSEEDSENNVNNESNSKDSNTQDTNDKKVSESEKLSENIVTPFSGNLNVDIDITPKNPTILSGDDASYTLTLKFTGSRTEYTDAEVMVDLPITEFSDFTQDVSELAIDGVVPTYDTSNQQLIYSFDSIDTGRSYERLLKIDTENGFSPNGHELAAQATFQSNEQLPVSDDAIVTIESSSSASVSKQYLSVQGNDNNIPTPGSKTLWEIKLEIPKKDIGQMFLKEGSQITITDLLPDGLSYDSMDSGPNPVQNEDELTWQFDAPTIEEQSSADTSLYTQTLQVWLTVDQGTADTTQNNQVDVDTTYIDDSTSTTSGQHEVDIVASEDANGEIEGTWYVPVNVGPSDGKGNIAPNDDKNPNPVVYDDALLGFSHGIAPLPESAQGDFQGYTTIYRVDSHLTLEKLSTPGGFVYRPSADFPAGIPLDQQPQFDILASVNGEEEMLMEDAEQNQTYTRNDLGLEESDRVNYIKYDFTYAPSGMLNNGRPNYYFGVEEGYTGEVVNSFNVYGVDADGNSFNYRYHEDDRDTIAGPRSATIAPIPDDQPPIAYVDVGLLDQDGGEIVTGSNRMEVKLTNSNSSILAMQQRLETVVLMPPGVTVNDSPNPEYIDKDGLSTQNSSAAAGGSYDILSNNYNDSGRQLVGITWNDHLLRPDSNLAAELDVTISENTPNHLSFQVYGFSGDEQLAVPDGEGTSVTDTTLETDTEDINDSGTSDEPRLKSGNNYYMRGEYQIESEKLVKGELDDAFSLFGQTVPGGAIDYQLTFTNVSGKDISSMTLIDVLPSVGDLGITDNVDRGSQFTPTLTSEITIPSSWTDRVDVVYSTAENPKRDDLIENTNYPETTEQLNNPPEAQDPNWMEASEVNDWANIHSFKIQSKNDNDWLDGESISISFSMEAPPAQEVSEDVLDRNIEPTSRAAWNSFAIATDNGQPVEPLRVGVYMNYTNSVSLLKVAEDGTALEGAEFKLLDEAGNELETGLVTDENGEIVVEDLFLGNYEFVETQAPTGYRLDSTPISFSIDVTQQDQLEIVAENTPVPGLVELSKVGEEGEALEGAAFTLLNEEGEELQTELATDENGQLLIEDLTPGNYQLVETQAPFGYELDDTPIPFEIDFNQQETLELTMENEQSTGSVTLTKSGENGNLLEDVVFELQNTEGDVLQEELTTNADGQLVISDLKPGSYQFVETSSITGYELDNTPIPFDIELGQTEMTEVSFENPLTSGSGKLTKVGEEGEALEGAAFTLLNEDGEELQTELVTDENGQLLIEDLTPGNYQLVETQAPFGYQLDDTPIPFEIVFNQEETLQLTIENSYTPGTLELTKVGEDGELLEGVVFELQDVDGNILQEGLTTDAEGKIILDELDPGSYQLVETSSIPGYELDNTPIPFDIELGQAETTEVSFENLLTPGSVELTKIGEEGEALEEAAFTLLNEEGEELQTELVTDENGQLLIEDLTPGNYQLVETQAPLGYQLDDTPIPFEIVFNQEETLQLTMENSYMPGTLELTKVGEDGELLEGAVFELQDVDGNILQGGLTTNAEGKLILDELDPGSYQLIETETLPGYKLDTTPISFEIGLGETESTQVEFTNLLSTGSVELTKVGEEGETLEGAEFTLLNEEGEELQTELATDENGQLVIEDLTSGNYQLVETQAPFGYQLDDTPIPFEIVFNQEEVLTVTTENSRSTSSVELTKVDEETKETLPGAVFELRQNGEVIHENLTTNENGKLFVDDLKPGTYQFVETEAANGYTLDSTPIEFTINLGQSETLVLSTDNAIVKGDFELTKVDFDNENLPLAGVGFSLKDADGNTIRDSIITDADGKLLIQDLRPGKYILMETDPLQGYNSHPPIEFTIDSGQLEAKKIMITNKQTRSGVELIKLDSDNEEKVLQGAEFALQDEEGNTITQGLTTDENGLITVDQLKPGVYYFVETKAPEGYVLDESPIKFTIDKGQSDRTEVNAFNQLERIEDESNNDSLPATATNMFRFTLLGGMLVIGGVIVLVFYRRRRY
ncbi:anchor [Gracilibacillus orientalis]|uniref:Anchor n=1 Tax=Gracilibacillus orientalis TaxID=334253 RepID=A0A1I4R3Q9_9BACI|nr:SpaA isopeptide-forming pilin-related protein [Gracilibacillus orientalis]SFM46563.1 anchor [Gracilibacillus orientalis]